MTTALEEAIPQKYTWSKNIHFRTFRGDALQDAEKWKRDFVVATSSLSDEAAARAFLTKIAPDSPASTYIDTLPHNTKISWLRLERAFRAHWTSTRRSDTSNTKSYDAFEIHVLTKEVVFDLAKRLDDVSASDGIDIWADDHLRLGRATGWPDEALIRMTRFLIPAFVQAILSLAPKPATFADMCMAVKQLPRGLLELERDRYYENEKKEERLSTIEQKLEAISEKMDKILNGGIVTQGASSTGGRVPVLDRNQTTSKGSETTSNISGSSISQRLDRIRPQTDNSIPTHWKAPYMSLTNDQRTDVVQKAIDELMKHLRGGHMFDGLDDDQCATAWSVLAAHGRVRGQSKNKKNLMSQAMRLSCPTESSTGRSNISYLQWGLALTYGHKASSDPELLRRASECWRIISRGSVINCTSVEPNGNHRPHNNTTTLCGGASVGPHNRTEVGSFETIMFMALSAFIADCRGGNKYVKAAVLSTSCIQDYMMDPVKFLPKDGVLDSQSCQLIRDNGISCFLTGMLLEGLSALARVTNDITWSSWARDIANVVMGMVEWHGSTGILSPTQQHVSGRFDVAASKGVLIRGICGAYSCNQSEVEFQNKARAYINVQFNALRDLARQEDSYGIEWGGPFQGSTTVSQMTALDVLVAGITANP